MFVCVCVCLFHCLIDCFIVCLLINLYLCICLYVFVYSFILFGNEDKRVGTAESDLEQRPLGADLLVIS